jgi:hypothetical protein
VGRPQPAHDQSSDSYKNTKGKTIFFPIFETVGFVARPEEVQRIKPPPMKMMLGNDHEAAEAAKSSPNDDIPF